MCFCWRTLSKDGTKPDVFALINTFASNKASNGIDMFLRVATELIYICPVSSSCSPHVTSCHVEALIALSPTFFIFFPLTCSYWSRRPHLYISFFFFSYQRKECLVLQAKKRSRPIFLCFFTACSCLLL